MKVDVFSCGRKGGSFEFRMPTVQRPAVKTGRAHTYIQFKQTRGLMDMQGRVHGYWGYQYTHMYMFRPTLSHCVLNSHTHTLSSRPLRCFSSLSRMQPVMRTATQERPCVHGVITTAVVVAVRRPFTPDSMGKWVHSAVRNPVGLLHPVSNG